MRTAIFDLETSSLYANSGIVLCAVIKEYRQPEVTIIRADQFKSWKSGKSDNREVIKAIMEALEPFNIYVAHNGQYFDKAWLNSACIKYGMKPTLRYEKFIDPVMLGRRFLRLARNSLASMLDYFDIEDSKTPIRFDHWVKASLDSDTESMDYIVKHCVKDVKLLERVYDLTKSLVKGIDEGGSAR